MSAYFRAAGSVVLFGFVGVAAAGAADQKNVEAAIKKGCDSLKARYGKNAVPFPSTVNGADYGIGPTCLAGLALLEAGTPVDDPALKTIISSLRKDSYYQYKTYQTSLCLMFLDRLGDPVDDPIIQMLAVRLLVGQNTRGGWGYDLCPKIELNDVKLLQGMKPNRTPGKFHPDVKNYAEVALLGEGSGSQYDLRRRQFQHAIRRDRSLDGTQTRRSG